MATHVYTGTARASAVLLPAGAYDASPTAIAANNFNQFTFLIAYTRGGAGGAVTYKIEISNDKSTWFQCGELQSTANVAGSDTVDTEQRAEVKYQATGATIERFAAPTLTVAANWYRINVKESGNVGSPGTVAILFTARGDL